MDTRKNKIFSEILATTTVDFIARDTGGVSIPRAVEFMEALLIQAADLIPVHVYQGDDHVLPVSLAL
jgi:hypothetical protein